MDKRDELKECVEQLTKRAINSLWFCKRFQALFTLSFILLSSWEQHSTIQLLNYSPIHGVPHELKMHTWCPFQSSMLISWGTRLAWPTWKSCKRQTGVSIIIIILMIIIALCVLCCGPLCCYFTTLWLLLVYACVCVWLGITSSLSIMCLIFRLLRCCFLFFCFFWPHSIYIGSGQKEMLDIKNSLYSSFGYPLCPCVCVWGVWGRGCS